jgi:hypothetical protein
MKNDFKENSYDKEENKKNKENIQSLKKSTSYKKAFNIFEIQKNVLKEAKPLLMINSENQLIDKNYDYKAFLKDYRVKSSK